MAFTAGDIRTHFEYKSCWYPLSTANSRQGPDDSTHIVIQEEKRHYLLYFKHPPNGKRTKTRHINRSYTSEFFLCKGQSCCSFVPSTINDSNPPKVSEWPEALMEHIGLARASSSLSLGFISSPGPKAHVLQAVSSPSTLDRVPPDIALFLS